MSTDRPSGAMNEPQDLAALLLLELTGHAAPQGDAPWHSDHRCAKQVSGWLGYLGLLDDSGQPTEFALAIAPLLGCHINTRLAVALGASQSFPGCTQEAIIIASILSVQQPLLVYPGNEREEACAAHRSFQQPSSLSDLTTLLEAFYGMEDAIRSERGAASDRAASAFAKRHYLNYRSFLEMRAQREHLLATAHALGWDIGDDVAGEQDLTAAFFFGYRDRLLRKRYPEAGDRVSYCRWQSVGDFYVNFPKDSFHQKGAEEELVLCVGLIGRGGSFAGRDVNGVAFCAMSPEQVSRLLPDQVKVDLQPKQFAGDEKDTPYEVWDLDGQLLATRPCPMPDAPPLGALNSMSHRSQGEVPSVEWTKTSKEPTWGDLSKKTSVPAADLKILVAGAFYDYPDKLILSDGSSLPVTYPDDGAIVVAIEAARALEIAPELSRDNLRAAWNDREVRIRIITGGGVDPEGAIDEFDVLLASLDA